MIKNFINKYIGYAKKMHDRFLIILISNVVEKSKIYGDFHEDSVIGDYYTVRQFQEMIDAILANGFELSCYYNENDFMKDYLEGVLEYVEKEIIVINTAKSGTNIGRKSLIPAFCELNKIKYLGCNPYIASFAKDKFHWHLLLDKFHIPVSCFWLFMKNNGWIKDTRPNKNEKVIAKLNNESCGIGLSLENICYYTPEFDDLLYDLSIQYNQNILVEKFISGYEVEVPLFITEKKTFSFDPIGITINGNFNIADKILDYNTRVKDNYVYKPFEILNESLSEILKASAEKAANIIGLSGLCRIDFRIDEKFNYFITDIATTPFITSNSSIGICFNELKYSYEDFFAFIISLVMDKYGLINNEIYKI